MNNNMNPIATLTNRKMTLTITKLPARLGRNNNVVDVYLFHESVSREHCVFECINRRFTVKDLNSTMGTFINGVKLEPDVPYNIEDGAKIQFGKVKMVFHADYQALANQERIQTPEKNAPKTSTGSNESFGPRERKHIQLSVREMNEFEYDEAEVIYIECGLKPEKKPLSYTSEIRKKEIEAVVANAYEEEAQKEIKELETEIAESAVTDDKKSTQVVEISEAEEANAEVADNFVSEFVDEEDTAKEEEPKHKKEKTVWLIWIDDISGETKKLKIDYFPFSIGRKSDENDYTIARKGVSRKHMRLEEEGGEIYIYDDASTNGVKLNGNRIEPEKRVKLSSGDRIRIVGITFSVKID